MFGTKFLEAKLDRLIQLQEEQTSLSRELFAVLTQRQAMTLRVGATPKVHRIATGKDVTIVTRAMREKQDFKLREAAAAPHRIPESGPASETTSTRLGGKSNGLSEDGSPRG